MDITIIFYGFAFFLGACFAVASFKNKRKREEDRMKEIIKQAINETKDNK